MGSAHFTPVPDLNEKVARMVAPHVRDVAKKVEAAAKRLAPGTKTWVSMGDDRVRDTHREAHADSLAHEGLPENLRFAVRGQPWDIAHGLSLGTDYLLHPKDTSSGLPYNPAGDHIRPDHHTGSAVQHVSCRCVAGLDPTGIARKIKTGPTEVTGAKVRVVVSCTHYKIVECEFGETYPSRIGMIRAEGTHFMGKAAAAAAGYGVLIPRARH